MLYAANQYEQVMHSLFEDGEVPKEPSPQQIDDVTRELVAIESLPSPDDLADVKASFGNQPIAIKTSVTMDDIFDHLDQATKETPEVRIQVFKNGTEVIHIGTNEDVNMHELWVPIGLKATVDFHTHPGGERFPSLTDVSATQWLKGKMLIGSIFGVTYVPTYEKLIFWDYWRYRSSRQKDSEDDGEIYKKFMTDEVRAILLARASLRSTATLIEVAGGIDNTKRP